MPRVDLLADLFDELGRNVESFGLAIHQDGNLVLGMQILAIGATAMGSAAASLAVDQGAGQHVAKRAEAADESAAAFEAGIAGHCPVTLIIVSERGQVQSFVRFAKMLKTADRAGNAQYPGL